MITQDENLLEGVLNKIRGDIVPIVPFNKSIDTLLSLDFTEANTELTSEILIDTNAFSNWVSKKLTDSDCRYGIGGYNEHRTIYSRSNLFDTNDEPRRLHLGTDIWGEVNTPVFCPLDATIHSFKFNNNFGDYGATLILKHQVSDTHFYTLYGHLSLASIQNIAEGEFIPAGKQMAQFGKLEENGYWPPHLHFQIIKNMAGYHGDYPGVCRYSERQAYLQNSPDPNLILHNTFH